jgi:Flp pilus assembly protein TadD
MTERYHAGAFVEAAQIGWELLKVDPREPVWLKLLALAEHRQGHQAAAIVLLKRAIKAEPDGVAQWNDLGNVYSSVGEIGLAEEAYRVALVHAPHCAEAYNNLGVMAGEREDYAEARRLYEKALALRPDYAEAMYNLGIALAALGRFQKAAHRYEQTLALTPDHARARFNLSLTRLLMGDLAGGWKDWESRWQTPQLAPALRKFPQPAWRGESLAGRTILLYAEQGLGDTLQFVRFVSLVAERDATIVLEVQASLVPLFQPLFDVWTKRHRSTGDDVQPGRIVAQGEDLPPFDLHCSLMSLPAVFQTTLRTIPSAAGYVRSARTLVRGSSQGLRVGLVWAGSPTHKRDHARSLPLAVLRPLLDLPDIQWISLQKGPSAGQLAELASVDPVFSTVENVAAGFEDYADTAAAVESLDLIITVDTSVAHLAGAMGKPVWVLLQQHLPDWRWLLNRKDSPWYASARLFRQEKAGDWEGVVTTLRSRLMQLLQCRPKSKALVLSASYSSGIAAVLHPDG